MLRALPWYAGGVELHVGILRRVARELARIPEAAGEKARRLWDELPEREREGQAGAELTEWLVDIGWEAETACDAGFGALSAAAAALVENSLRNFLKQAKVQLPARPQWRELREGFQKKTGRRLCALRRYSEVETVRLMSNCFKHNDSRADKELAPRLGIAVGDPITFRSQPWDDLLSGVQRFLLDAGATLRLA